MHYQPRILARTSQLGEDPNMMHYELMHYENMYCTKLFELLDIDGADSQSWKEKSTYSQWSSPRHQEIILNLWKSKKYLM
jgi:hypothetical protein